MIASFKLTYSAATGLTVEQHARLLAAVPDLPDYEKVKADSWHTHYTADLRKVIKTGIEIELGGARDGRAEVSAVLALDEKLDALVDKVGKLQSVNEEHHHSFNSKCSVHVPGLGLLMIDEVDVLDDACTDRLQEKMKEGWRILAICPQADQRRPDYVIGKSQNMMVIQTAKEAARLTDGIF